MQLSTASLVENYTRVCHVMGIVLLKRFLDMPSPSPRSCSSCISCLTLPSAGGTRWSWTSCCATEGASGWAWPCAASWRWGHTAGPASSQCCSWLCGYCSLQGVIHAVFKVCVTSAFVCVCVSTGTSIPPRARSREPCFSSPRPAGRTCAGSTQTPHSRGWRASTSSWSSGRYHTS